MGLKNKSKRYLEKNLSPDVRESLGFTDAYFARKRERRNKMLFSALTILGVGSFAVLGTGISHTTDKCAELNNERTKIISTITNSEKYTEAKRQYEQELYAKYSSGEITFEDMVKSIKDYKLDMFNILACATSEQIEELEDNMEQAEDYQDQANKLICAAVPVGVVTGGGCMLYLGRKHLKRMLGDIANCHDELDLT